MTSHTRTAHAMDPEMQPQHSALAEALQTLLTAGEQLARLESIEARLEEIAAHSTAEQLGAGEGSLHPDHAYSYDQVAQYLGQKRASVRQISHELLPRVGHGRVLGIDIMAYRGEITYEEATAYKRARRQRVLRYIGEDRAANRSISPQVEP